MSGPNDTRHRERQTMTQIYVEVRPGPRAHSGDLGPLGNLRQKLTDRIDDIGDGVKEIAANLASRLDDIAAAAADTAWHLGEVEITFSLDLETETGVILARAKTGAAFEVKLTWKKGSSIGHKG
jgi:hypothetical protein